MCIITFFKAIRMIRNHYFKILSQWILSIIKVSCDNLQAGQVIKLELTFRVSIFSKALHNLSIDIIRLIEIDGFPFSLVGANWWSVHCDAPMSIVNWKSQVTEVALWEYRLLRFRISEVHADVEFGSITIRLHSTKI